MVTMGDTLLVGKVVSGDAEGAVDIAGVGSSGASDAEVSDSDADAEGATETVAADEQPLRVRSTPVSNKTIILTKIFLIGIF
jgi:hypothetical protein